MDSTARQSELSAFWEWDLQNVYHLIERIGYSNYLRLNPSLGRLFEVHERKVVCCVDSRVCVRDYLGGILNAVPAGGALITLEPEEGAVFLNRARAKEICSHSGCGAGRALFLKLRKVAPKSPEQLDEFVIEQTMAYAKLIGAEYAGHIRLESMRKSALAHPVRSLALIGTEAFAPYDVTGFHTCYRVSARYHNRATALAEVIFCLGIAFSEYGYGDRFTAEHPFYLLAFADVDSPGYGPNELLPILHQAVEVQTPDVRKKIQIASTSWSPRQQKLV